MGNIPIRVRVCRGRVPHAPIRRALPPEWIAHLADAVVADLSSRFSVRLDKVPVDTVAEAVRSVLDSHLAHSWATALDYSVAG